MRNRNWLTSLLILAAGTSIPLSVSAEEGEALNPIDIREWKVPYEGRPRDPFAVSEDEIWFCGQSNHYIARLTPSSGEFFKRDLPDEAGPHNLIVDGDGIVWYAGNLKGYIGRYDPETDQIDKIPMPDDAVRDPHTLVFDAVGEHIWFTAQRSNHIGRLRLSDRHIDLVPVATPKARPYGIRIAPDGTPWIVLLGTHKLASVDPKSLELTEYVIPADGARPRRLEVSDDGRVWYADYARGYLGVYDPDAEAFDEWALPSGKQSRPYGTARDKRGRVWVVETGVVPNLFVGFDTEREEVVSITPIPSKGATVRHMDYHAATDSVWFGTDMLTIGRADVSTKD